MSIYPFLKKIILRKWQNKLEHLGTKMSIYPLKNTPLHDVPIVLFIFEHEHPLICFATSFLLLAILPNHTYEFPFGNSTRSNICFAPPSWWLPISCWPSYLGFQLDIIPCRPFHHMIKLFCLMGFFIRLIKLYPLIWFYLRRSLPIKYMVYHSRTLIRSTHLGFWFLHSLDILDYLVFKEHHISVSNNLSICRIL